MILSVSRRTDIPAFYSEWFLQRLKEKVVYIQNPFNPKNIYSVNLEPHLVDCIVFWTKNPENIINKLKNIEKLGYRYYYFLFTINLYETLEINLPPLEKRLNAFKELTAMIGSERMIWRYDPIIISSDYTESYHVNTFHRIAEKLSGFTNTCKTSFLTHYKKIKRRMPDEIREVEMREKVKLFGTLQNIADSYNINLELCSEEIIGFEDTNVGCINKELIEHIFSYKLNLKKDKNQRSNCKCIESVDIGAYNTCNHQCFYCYANSGNVAKSIVQSPYLPILGRELTLENYNLIERKVESNRNNKNTRPNLFS